MLYLLERTGYVDYDTTSGLVVRAESPEEARQIAAGRLAGDEDMDEWLRADSSTCVALMSDGPSEIILRDFRAG